VNAHFYKVIFSRRLGTLVAVGEHACAQGKSASGEVTRSAVLAAALFLGSLNASFALDASALPTGGDVRHGAATVGSVGATMTINQTSSRATINWQSFNVGSGAKVNIVQPSSSAALLNRVVGNNPSQIHGQINANGQVVLVNPNGVLVGSSGAITASAFTATTFGISDADFESGKMRFTRDGSSAGVSNEGSINTNGGYVALSGASVSNSGTITTGGGAAMLGAGDAVSIPLAGNIRLELDPAAFASVDNSGTITTSGGQVFMRASAVVDAVSKVANASVTHTGTINSGGGRVDVLADQGTVRVSGAVNASGGSVFIGRDEQTNTLAAVGDASGAQIESQDGFVETSGQLLKVDGARVIAKYWLLDPSDITISNSSDSNVTGTSPTDITPTGGDGTASVVSVATIQSAINAGTSVTIKTTNASNATGAGNITIASALAFNNQGTTDATLSLVADNGITQNAGASITTDAASTQRVHISMTANGNYQGIAAESASSQGVELKSTINTNGTVTISGTNKNTGAGAGVQFSNGASITTTSGSAITVTGTATAGTAYGVELNNTLLDAGAGGDVSITGTSFGNHGIYNHFSGSGAFNMRLVGRNVSLNGTSSGVGTSGFYSYIGQSAGNNITASGDIAVTGTANGSGAGSALFFASTNWQTYVNSYTAGGSITFNGTNTASSNSATAIRFFGMQATTTGAGGISVNASTQNASTHAIVLHSAGNIVGFGYQGGATSLVSTSGDVKLQANQGGISFNDGVPNNVTPTTISGRNISIDNTGGTIDTNTGAITRGAGSGSAGISISDGRAFNATGNINLYGAGTTGSGVAISAAATLSATNITINGENTGTSGAAINMSHAASSLTASGGITLTSGGTGSGTSLVAAGNMAVGTQLRITTPAAGSIAGVISGNGSLLKMGAGQTRLTAFDGTTYGTNTFSGGTTISQGSLLFGNGNGNYNKTAGTGAVTLGDANTGTSDVGLWIEKGVGPAQDTGRLTRPITVTSNGTGTATIGAANGAGTGWSIIAGTIDLQRNVTFADTTNDRLGLDGQITGAGNITIAGTGSGNGPRVSMGSAKTFTGDVTINAGVQLQANASNLFNSSTNVQANGTFNLNSTSQAINSLNGESTGRVTNGGTLTIGSNNGDGSFAGITSNGTRLVKNGTGTQILSGNNTYTGGTQVAAGTLQIGNGTTNGLIGHGAVDIAAGATLNFNVNTTAVNYANSNTFTGGGTFRKTGNAGLSWGVGVANFSLGAGSLIDVQQGTLTGAGNANDIWTNNRASLNVAGGAIFAGVEGSIIVDALTGAGTVTSGFAGYAYGLTVGVNGGSGTFSGSIQNSHSQNANLTKIGAGTQTLSGASTLTGVTTVIGGTLALGHVNALQSSTLDTGTSGAQQVTFTVAGTNTYNIGALRGADDLAIGANSISAGSNNASTTYSGVLSGSGNFTKVGTGTTTFSGNNTYDGTTTISGGTLQVGNAGSTGILGAGSVTLSNNANLHYSRSATTNIFNTISGTGNLSATITGASSNLSVSGAVNLTGGTINLSTDANLTLSQSLTTNNTTNAAIVLNAGAATSAGTSTGGDISFTGSGAVNVVASARATLYTGSLSGSTGLSVSAGNNRYNSDELTNNYTAALGSGTYAIYREAPTLNVRFNDASKTYDAQAFTGGNGLSVVSGFVKDDTSTTLSGISYSGTAQNATNAGTFAISGTALNSQGYVLSYTNGSLTIDKASLVLSGSRDYDASTSFAGQYLTATGVAGQTFSLTGAGDSSNLSSKHVADNQNVALSSVTGLSLGASSNGGLADNYHSLSVTGSTVSLSTKAASLTATAANVTYNGLTQQQSYTSSTIAGDAISVSGLASATNAGTYTSAVSVSGVDSGNYTFSLTNANLVIGKANLVLSGSREYDASTTFAGQYLTATGVAGQTFSLTGAGDSSNLSSKHVADNQNVALSSVTGLSLGASSNGGLADNYNAISATGSAITLTRIGASLTATAANFTYNGLTQQQSYTSSILAGDEISVSGLASATNAGTYTSAVSVSGADAGNYVFSLTNADLVIDRRDISITGLTAANKTFDGNTSASITGASFDNLVAGESLGLSGAGTFSDAAAGNNKTVTVPNVAALNQNNAIGLWQNYRLLSTGPMTALASITASSGNNNNNNNNSNSNSNSNSSNNQPGPDSGNPAAALVPSSRAPSMTYPPVEPTQLRPSFTWATRSPSPLEQTVTAVAANNPFKLSSDEPETTANDFNLVLACDNTGPEDGLKLCYER
jgi:filamentous hemagglutinin family protein